MRTFKRYGMSEKEELVYRLEKVIAERQEHLAILSKAVTVLQTLTHLKTVNKRCITALKNAGIYASLYQDYTPHLVFYIENKQYAQSEPDKNGCSIADYYSDDTPTIYFHDTDTYAQIVENIQARITGIEEEVSNYRQELAIVDSILHNAELVRDAKKKFDEYSYVTREVLFPRG